jgi:HD-GYP domain-containing protein (c-di-GMP phosphodiesterase class II)
MLQRIPPSEVQPGMFITAFGGRWFDHPFWKRRFKVESATVLERIRACNVPWVEIDPSRGTAATKDQEAANENDANVHHPKRRKGRMRGAYRPILTSPAQRSARATVSRTGAKIRGVFNQMELGWRADTGVIEEVFDDIAREIEHNADALLTVVGLKTKDDYTYLHSVAVCALMVCTARHRNMSPEEVRDLGMAGLLHDIGKIRIADAILKKPGKLTNEEYQSAQCHSQFGFELLKDVPDIPELALDVCLHHHEKLDGTGYPFGLAGDEISYAARLGAVCDVFDALTSNRAYKKPWSRHKALSAMWSWEGHFDREILAELMQVLHVYPGGLLVALSNGMLAMTCEAEGQYETVKAIEFYSAKDSQWSCPRQVTIARHDPALAVKAIEDPAQWGFDDWPAIQTKLRAARLTRGKAYPGSSQP